MVVSIVWELDHKDRVVTRSLVQVRKYIRFTLHVSCLLVIQVYQNETVFANCYVRLQLIYVSFTCNL